MRLYLAELRLALKRREEIIPFHDFSYFYGQMGAGKTSIARLVDYCLGGELELSPALQSEFVAATLALEIEGVRLFVERQRDSDRVRAAWSKDEAFEVVLPVRHPAGVVIKDTDVETLSDLIYHLAGMQPPRVRRSKERDDSDLGRLSIRDLLWYCYLDQDEIDSSFFHLEQGGHPFRRLKSRDVLRFVLGYHQERVAALESELEETRFRRLAVSMGALSLERALKEVGVSSEQDIEARVNGLEGELREVATTIRNARDAASADAPAHGTDTLRERARFLSADLASVQESLVAIERAIASDTRHLHEIQTLSLKIRRSIAARAVLEGVAFVSCPRCAQKLPDRPASDCSVCGQDDSDIDTGEPKNDVVAQDARARIAELTDALARHHIQLRRARSESEALSHSKAATERELSEALRDYDSVYLSTALIAERRGATLTEQIAQLNGLRRLPEAVTRQRQEAAALAGREAEIRAILLDARKGAESDTRNLDLLGELFLDCLLRARVPGIAADDRVIIRPPHFLPEVLTASLDDLAITSFSNLSSGGKKTLFKCCFAVALHRLASRTRAILPLFLIIDSPMKNISERENRQQFEGFHEMLYSLKASELADTQFILIDKEFAPPQAAAVEVIVRHMTPDDPANPPLIPYYRGH
jgi:hypothetical protein